MGLDFIRAKGERFTQKRDDARCQELDTEDLLSRGKPDRIEIHFRCQSEEPTTVLTPGEAVIGRAMSNAEVAILVRGKRIGRMLPEDTVTLVDAMKRNHRHGGIITLIIVEEPSWDGVFVVKPKSRFK